MKNKIGSESCPLCNIGGTLENFERVMLTNTKKMVKCSNCEYEVNFSDFMLHTLLNGIKKEIRNGHTKIN